MKTLKCDYKVSMKNGTVLSGIYDLIKGNQKHPEWNQYIEPDGYDVVLLVESPSTRDLSPYELRIIKQIDDEFGNLYWGRLCDLTHTFPEWHNSHHSSESIDPSEILRSIDTSEAENRRNWARS